MDFKQLYLSLDGRINRKVFWLNFFLPVVIITIILAIIDSVAGTNGIIVIIWQLAIIWPSIAVQAKRWHDRNKSAWWILINLVPVIGGIWALVEVGFLAGTEGENRFGPDPLRS